MDRVKSNSISVKDGELPENCVNETVSKTFDQRGIYEDERRRSFIRDGESPRVKRQPGTNMNEKDPRDRIAV